MPDVVLSDVMMPGTDGHELVRVLRSSAETDFLSIVLLTVQAEDERRLEGLERGADDYIVKPFEMRELDARVRNLIASRRRLRERFAAAGTSGLRTGDSAGKASAAGGNGGPASVAPVDAAYMERVRARAQPGIVRIRGKGSHPIVRAYLGVTCEQPRPCKDREIDGTRRLWTELPSRPTSWVNRVARTARPRRPLHAVASGHTGRARSARARPSAGVAPPAARARGNRSTEPVLYTASPR